MKANNSPDLKAMGNGILGLAPQVCRRVHARGIEQGVGIVVDPLSNYCCRGLVFGAQAVGIFCDCVCLTGIQRDSRNNAQQCEGNCTTSSLALPLSLADKFLMGIICGLTPFQSPQQPHQIV